MEVVSAASGVHASLQQQEAIGVVQDDGWRLNRIHPAIATASNAATDHVSVELRKVSTADPASKGMANCNRQQAAQPIPTANILLEVFMEHPPPI